MGNDPKEEAVDDCCIMPPPITPFFVLPLSLTKLSVIELADSSASLGASARRAAAYEVGGIFDLTRDAVAGFDSCD